MRRKISLSANQWRTTSTLASLYLYLSQRDGLSIRSYARLAPLPRHVGASFRRGRATRFRVNLYNQIDAIIFPGHSLLLWLGRAIAARSRSQLFIAIPPAARSPAKGYRHKPDPMVQGSTGLGTRALVATHFHPANAAG